MKANELRLGNYYLYHIVDSLDERGEYDEVCQIDVEDFRILESFDCPEYNPIPLTEEWLLKFGFVRFDNLGGYCKEDDDYNFVVSKTSGGYDNDVCLYVIQYVHRLQNLYFALTGEELTANTKK